MVKQLSSLVIRFEDVVKVVNYLREMTSTIDGESPLLYLSVVEERITQPNRVLSDRLRVDALADLICELITESYEAQLYHLDATRPEIYTRTQALEIIASYRQTSIRLIGLALLYFCHVRAEFDIGYDLFGDTVAMSPRNLRRIKRGSVGFIQQLITRREEQTRKRLHLRLLRRALPHMGSNVLFGRDAAMNDALRILAKEAHHKLVLFGDRGCGKTAFAEQLAFQYIQQYDVDYVLWVHGSEELNESTIRHRLGIDHRTDLAEAVMYYEILVVIDGFLQDTGEIMRLIPHARYILICNSLNFIINDAAVLHLTPLSNTDIERVGRLYANKYLGAGYDIGDDFLNYMVRQAAGNPQAIKLMLKSYFEASATAESSQNDEDVALMCLFFTREHFIEQGKIKYFWGGLIPDDIWPRLTHRIEHVIFEQKRFIKLKTGEEARLRAYSGGFVPDRIRHQITTGLIIQPEIGLYVVHTILKERGKLDPAWAHTLIELEATLSDHTLWFECLQAIYQQRRLFSNDEHALSKLCVALSVCCRHSGQPEQGLDLLADVHSFEALLERVQCHRYMGNYETAFDIMESAHIDRDSLSRQQRDLFSLTYAQLLIDIRDGERAISHLHDCSTETRQSALFELIHAEASGLLMGSETIVSFDGAVNRWPISSDDTRITLHLNFMRGCLAYSSNTALAARYFLVALQIAQSQPRTNRIIIGRCLSNIGACYVRQEEISMAYRYLQQAEQTQIETGDKLGLMYTSRNIELMNKCIA